MATTATWRAPGRVNLIGEHTDYNEGFVLPMAIGYGCTATVTVLDSGELRIRSAQQDDEVRTPLAGLRPERVPGWAGYAAGVLWALASDGVELPGLDVAVDGDVPLGAGLSSSAALTCAVAAAVDGALGLGRDRRELVALARRAENDFVGAPTGGMDQLASMLCEAGNALRCDMRTLETRAVPFDLAAAGLALVVTDTNAPHHHADGEYARRRESCERAAALLGVAALRDVDIAGLPAAADRLRKEPDGEELLRRARHVVTDNARVDEVVALVDAGRIGAIGPLLTASHVSLRDDFEVTVPELDVSVQAVLDAGALGARMTGGGFGGCVIALVPEELVDKVTAAAKDAAARHGFAVPESFTTEAAAGAHRLDPEASDAG